MCRVKVKNAKAKLGVGVGVYEDRDSTVMGFLSSLSDQDYCTVPVEIICTHSTQKKRKEKRGKGPEIGEWMNKQPQKRQTWRFER